jgi:hypothetical protein
MTWSKVQFFKWPRRENHIPVHSKQGPRQSRYPKTEELLRYLRRLDELKVVLTSLIQWWYNMKNVTRLMAQGFNTNNIVISWLYRTCWNNLATSLIIPTRLLQVLTVCYKLVDNLGQAVRTQLVDSLLAGLLQDARFLPAFFFTLAVQICFCLSFLKYQIWPVFDHWQPAISSPAAIVLRRTNVLHSNQTVWYFHTQWNDRNEHEEVTSTSNSTKAWRIFGRRATYLQD